MSKPTIIVEGLSKKFSVSLKDSLKYGIIDSSRILLGMEKKKELRQGEFWALQNVNFELHQGDALGIMGINGSGKTTLLRILNSSYAPDSGCVKLRGKIGALVAAGAGFSPMLSGRENVFVSAALLGMSPNETRRRFDEIVAFSGLEEFIDMPVRNYSSGMAVRLGFSVAVMGAPEILLIDEVLAVGDMNFQKKCYEKIHALKKSGTTIILVSHSPGAIWAVCNKGLVLHKGKSSGVIPVEEACRTYDYNNLQERLKQKNNVVQSNYSGSRGGTGDVYVNKVQVLDEQKLPINETTYGNTFYLRFNLEVRNPISDAILRVLVDSEVSKSISVLDNYEVDGGLLNLEPGMHIVDIKLKKPTLRPGIYHFSSAVVSQGLGVHLFYEQNQVKLMVNHAKDKFFYAEPLAVVQFDLQYELHKTNELGNVQDDK
jgi:lipopolysaccharide transport system ATP-binding protein